MMSGMFRPEIRSFHFVGICGTAMASAAAALQEQGYVVTGSDEKVYPPMSTFLAERGIKVMNGYAERNLAHRPDLVVIGNAISRGNPEAEAVLEPHALLLPAGAAPRVFHPGQTIMVVTGTHGKTTTTALLAWVFEHNGLNPSFLIGGIPNNFSQGARFTDSDWFIIEGDEYDTAFFDKRSKFVHYLPEVVVLNNLEFDHADIFTDLAAIQTSFSHLIRVVPRNGLVLANGDDAESRSASSVQVLSDQRFGFGEDNHLRAFHLRMGATATEFETPNHKYHIDLVGELNVRNALAVIACARHCGLTNAPDPGGFSRFQGRQAASRSQRRGGRRRGDR